MRDLLRCCATPDACSSPRAVESLDDRCWRCWIRGTRGRTFTARSLMRAAGLALNPTFIAFTPWTTRAAYSDLLREIAALDLMDNVSPIQLACGC